jgi:Flp pilus assembly protein TadD
MIRYLCLSGRPDETAPWAERLKAVDVDAVDLGLKKAEALSYLGDDEGVLAAFREAEHAGSLENGLAEPLLYHLAAVAALRLEREDEARQYWQQAREAAPGFELARDNLADLRKPVGERHAPWPFSFANWITPKALKDLATQVAPMADRSDEVADRALRRYLRQHPALIALVPQLLDRGDPAGREFALRLAMLLKSTELLAALKDFALGQRGPDDLRLEAASVAADARLLQPGSVRLWMRGAWSEIVLLGFEIHGELTQRHPPRVMQLLDEAMPALKGGEAERAEHLLRQALEIEPEAPDLLNNLAMAHVRQGRPEAAEALLRQVRQRQPDNAFTQASLARLLLSQGELDEAAALLEPLLSRKRFYRSEFAVFCEAQIDFYLAQENVEAAHTWLDLWENADPDHPGVELWRQRLGSPTL